MKHQVKTSSGNTLTIEDTTTLADIQSGEPLFFKTKHGRRETYTMHRGSLIVRNTDHSDFGTSRRTAVYLYVTDPEEDNKRYTLCVSSGNDIQSVDQAKRLVDEIIRSGSYAYGMPF